MRILLVQLNPVIGDLQGNKTRIISSLKRAREVGAEIAIFPEMSICGYPPEDLLLHDSFISAMEKALEEIIPETDGLLAVVGLVRRNLSSGEKSLLNSAAIIREGKLIGFHDKWLLPTYDVFDERRYFEPGRELQLWEYRGKRMGVLICEDIWQHAGYVSYSRYPRDPVLELASLKPDLMLNLSASPYQFQKADIRLNVCQKAAKTLNCPVVMCCQVGGNDQLIFDGYSLCVNKKGEVIEMAKGFEEDELLIDPEAASSKQIIPDDPIADLYHALLLGTRDYFYKQGFKKCVLGLSGGIDSSLVACIAADALGAENVYGVGMPSRYSSTSSLTDAEKLAKNLGIHFDIIPIEEPFVAYTSLLAPFFQGMNPDTTEENLQARIRGALLMAFSNKFGYLLLSTGNKSEMGMGYCTLYGDTTGGMAVISDVTKTQVYALAKWVNQQGERIPYSCIEKPPSAELRPNQRDTDTLPEYPILDLVLQAYVEDLLSPEEIGEKYNLPLPLVQELVCRIHRAEYKRRQVPPGIRVSKKAFHIGRRYPIVQKWVKS